ncbi:MAG: hypothetical protein RMJ31_06890 [Nitrososphaerota archaeon]|nr:hypothetical protein [Nitrososphaerota archaeon]
MVLKITFKIKRSRILYFRENPGAVFIIGFQILLIYAAGALINGETSLANEVAIYAYYSLVVGVVLQLIAFIRSKV